MKMEPSLAKVRGHGQLHTMLIIIYHNVNIMKPISEEFSVITLFKSEELLSTAQSHQAYLQEWALRFLDMMMILLLSMEIKQST